MAAWVLLAGCTLEGEDRTFPDESEKVTQLRVNAYAEGEGAVIETIGMDAGGEYHAFSGRVSLVLEKQRGTEAGPLYAAVEEWTFDVVADDFASPNYPRHKLVVEPGVLREAGTYRVRGSAQVEGRTLAEATALFAFPAP